jgi:3-phenylpropionate/trans-cinnamate dioxygenase ferredoxin subunit
VAFVRVVSLDEIEDGQVVGVEASGKPLCLARVADTIYAFANNCSHRDFPLSYGEVDTDDCSITCEWHGARFDMRTGKALALPATRPIRVYDCRIEDGVVYVDVG